MYYSSVISDLVAFITYASDLVLHTSAFGEVQIHPCVTCTRCIHNYVNVSRSDGSNTSGPAAEQTTRVAVIVMTIRISPGLTRTS
jgi:hypothetical protein